MPFKETILAKCHLSDRQLHVATSFARGAELWCASGVLFWGGGVALGLGVLGLKAAGIAVPFAGAAGVSSIVFGVAMAAKSVVLQKAFHALHQKGLRTIEQRKAEKAPLLTVAASPAPSLMRAAHSRLASFNAKARFIKALALLPHPTQSRARTKAAAPGGPRLPL